jgi:uncharacterized FlaG/YvyC family protein
MPMQEQREDIMKINSSTAVIGYSAGVLDKQGGGSSHQDQPQDQKRKAQDNLQVPENVQESEEASSSGEQIDQAVEAFQHEMEAQSNGLSATVEGTGPGLKVVLKDGAGSVVRQFSGEEFVKMRKSSSKDGRVRGKILDQKL